MQKENEDAILEKLSNLYIVVHQCEDERNRSHHNLANIAKTHERLQHEQKMSPYFKSKLKGLYDTALQDANCEVELLRKALTVIHSIRALQNEKRQASKNTDRSKETIHEGALMMLQESGPTLPLWIGKRNEAPPPLCGAIPAAPNYVAKVHDMVAALAEGAEGEENWMIAEVMSYNHNTHKYEVDDIDEEQKDSKHNVSRKRIIPLPLMRANPETNPEALFPKDTMVLAVYPQTTCFYAAVVKKPPAKPQDNYQILFEDSSYPEGYSPPISVCQRYVICYKEGSGCIIEDPRPSAANRW